MVFGDESAESYYDEGLTHSMKGDIARAVTCFEKAIQMDPELLSAQHQLAKCEMRIGHFQKAAQRLVQVIKRRPHQVPPRIDMAHVLYLAGKHDEARKQYNEILQVEPSNTRALLALGQIAFDKGDWQTAISYAEQSSLTGSAPSFPTMYLQGRAARLTGNKELADESLKQADILIQKTIEVNPDSPEGYYLRGEVCYHQGRFNNALECYRAAADRAEAGNHYFAFGEHFTYTDMLVKQGLCYQQVGKPDRAVDIGYQLERIDPDNLFVKAFIGEQHQKKQ